MLASIALTTDAAFEPTVFIRQMRFVLSASITTPRPLLVQHRGHFLGLPGDGVPPPPQAVFDRNGIGNRRTYQPILPAITAFIPLCFLYNSPRRCRASAILSVRCTDHRNSGDSMFHLFPCMPNRFPLREQGCLPICSDMEPLF